MGTVDATGTPVGGQQSGVIATSVLPAFTGQFTVEVKAANPYPSNAIGNFDVAFMRSSDGATCWHGAQSITGGQSSSGVNTWIVGQTGGTWSCTDWDRLQLSVTSSLNLPAITLTAEITAPSLQVAYCQYGTQLQSNSPLSALVTVDLLVDLGVFLVSPWFAPLAAGLIGLIISINDLCSHQRPDLADPQGVGTNPFDAAIHPDLAHAYQSLRALLWDKFCQCTPAPSGQTPPIAPPKITSLPPPGGVTIVPADVICDEGELCDTLNKIVQMISALSLQTSYLRRDLTLVQRQEVPFSYITGATHSGLTNSGELAVSGILGLHVTCTTVPNRLGRNETVIPEYISLGRISLGTGDGYLESINLEHNPQLVLNIPAAISALNYDLEAGVVATIVELVREP